MTAPRPLRILSWSIHAYSVAADRIKENPLDYDGQRVFSFPTTAFLIAGISSQRKTILMTTIRIAPQQKGCVCGGFSECIAR